MSATRLYTPEVLGLATSLSEYPLDDSLPLVAEARSRSCGSTIVLGLETDADGRIANVGVRSQACAIGQAAAAIFAAGAKGLTAGEIAIAENAISAWLAGDGPLPDWPGMDAIALAHEYPGRHGAIKLAWEAARQVLPTS
ncbi:MAG: iron-sulfur cluster assembly scaffold protein [Novosphingobium sp.]|nr:iron-sulfur cluster assembly scaffold protein [Novosphingobium sp.]